MFERIIYLLDSIHQMEPGQLTTRMMRKARFRWIYPLAAPYLFPLSIELISIPQRSAYLFNEKAASHLTIPDQLLQQAEELCIHRFAFLNMPSVEVGFPVDWTSASTDDRLWNYHLHYGEWALVLVYAYLVANNDHFLQTLIELLGDWLDHNPVGSTPGWEPYPLSRRLVAWARLGRVFEDSSSSQAFWQNRLIPSLRQQARVLAANLERDMADNHLIENYRALAWVGMYFPQWSEAARLRSLGLGGLVSEMRRQVLADGAHDERSISYHTVVLQDFLETWCLATRAGIAIPVEFSETMVRMFKFLASTQAPNGSWPMVNDSVPDYPINPQSLLAAGAVMLGQPHWLTHVASADPAYLAWLTERPLAFDQTLASTGNTVAAFPEAGYAVLRGDSGDYLFFDAGPMAPGRIPGHGHADTLSIVLYGQGRPLIVDPGVYTYQAGPWRDHFRSTAAHNSIAVDGQDQCVFWGAFRVAYLPHAHLSDWSDSHVAGEHTGYQRFSEPVLHRRQVTHKGPGVWEIQDRLEGHGEHLFSLSFQFTADAQASCDGRNSEIHWPSGVRLRITPAEFPENAFATIVPGWHSRGWNLKDEAPRYVLNWRAAVPFETRLLLEVGR